MGKSATRESVAIATAKVPTNTVLRVPFLPSHRLAYEARNLRSARLITCGRAALDRIIEHSSELQSLAPSGGSIPYSPETLLRAAANEGKALAEAIEAVTPAAIARHLYMAGLSGSHALRPNARIRNSTAITNCG